MSLIPFPNVPNVPGVPSLLRHATVPTPDALVNQGVSTLVQVLFGAEEWCIYNEDDSLALQHEAFMSIDFTGSCKVSNYTREDGEFAPYNKVEVPYTCKVQLVVGEDAASRERFLDKLDDMLNSTDLYKIVTPEFVYTGATLQQYQYKRSLVEGGVRIIIADLTFAEVVRKDEESTKRKTAKPGALEMLINGQIQQVKDVQAWFETVGTNLKALGKQALDAIEKRGELRWPVL